MLDRLPGDSDREMEARGGGRGVLGAEARMESETGMVVDTRDRIIVCQVCGYRGYIPCRLHWIY